MEKLRRVRSRFADRAAGDVELFFRLIDRADALEAGDALRDQLPDVAMSFQLPPIHRRRHDT